jgi:hypothetical protein
MPIMFQTAMSEDEDEDGRSVQHCGAQARREDGY